MSTGRIAAVVALVGIAIVVAIVMGRSDNSPTIEAEPLAATQTTTTLAQTADADDAARATSPTSSTSATATTDAADLLPVLGEAPALEDLDGWLQSDVTSLEELRGSVVVVEFWTFGCHNCKATLPYLQDIYARYRDRGLEIVGVHSPEFDYEKDPVSIQDAADRLGVTWPIALDTTKVNFGSWQEGATKYWPRTYVIDQQGRIRFDHIGEGAYDELEATVAALLDAA